MQKQTHTQIKKANNWTNLTGNEIKVYPEKVLLN